MTASIFPDTTGDIILNFAQKAAHNNEVEGDVPTLFACDADGNEKPFGRLFEVRDGGGHLEAKGFHLSQESTGFVPGENNLLQIVP